MLAPECFAAFLLFSMWNLSHWPTWIYLGVSHLPVISRSLPFVCACCSDGCSERRDKRTWGPEAVVLMFSPWSFDLASGQLPLISVLVDDYRGKWVVRRRSCLPFTFLPPQTHSHLLPRAYIWEQWGGTIWWCQFFFFLLLISAGASKAAFDNQAFQ